VGLKKAFGGDLIETAFLPLRNGVRGEGKDIRSEGKSHKKKREPRVRAG